MRSRVRVFVAVGAFVTAVDLGIFLLLEPKFGLLIANIGALIPAAVFSYLLNRILTFKSSSRTRWVSNPAAFFATALVAALFDTTFVFVIFWLTEIPLISKVIAIGIAGLIRWFAYRSFLFQIVRAELSSRNNRSEPPGECRISVVLPAYNEATRIADSITTLTEEFVKSGIDSYEILVVDDASADNTSEVASQFGATVITQKNNTGKGGAVRSGILAAKGKVILFTDSDLAYPPDLVPTFLAAIEDGWDMAVGNRRLPGSNAEIATTVVRRLGGWVVNKLTHIVLLGQFRDTQCGIKAFRSDVGKSMAERLTTTGFGFDVELFIMAEIDRLSLVELPVKVRNRPGSSVSLISDTFALIGDLISIRRAAGRGAYSKSAVSQDHQSASSL